MYILHKKVHRNGSDTAAARLTDRLRCVSIQTAIVRMAEKQNRGNAFKNKMDKEEKKMDYFADSFSLLEKAVADGVTPSAAAAVGVGGRLLARAVYGNARLVPEPVPATLDTRYDMASLTKIMAATMTALQMIEDGRLHLEDTLGAYFDVPASRAGITVFQLMTHTSGIAPHILLSDHASGPDDALRVILESAPVCPPGTQVHYSCMGYILLGKILEQLGGAPLDVLANRYVFAPLDMRHTGYRPAGDNIAATEIHCLCGVVHDENARFLGGVSGNAGVFSDLADCTAFASMLACGGVYRGRTFLSPDLMRDAIRNHTPGMGENRGLGFHLRSEGSFHGSLFPMESFGHTGFAGTSILVDPASGLYAVLLSNRVHPSREDRGFLTLRRQFHDAALAFSLPFFYNIP